MIIFKRMRVLLLAFALLNQNPTSHAIHLNYTGDFIIGAFFPIHRKGPGGERCGRLQMEDGIQPLEAMLYVVDQINNDPELLPNITLGVIAFDSCDNPAYAMEQALYFVKGFIAHHNTHHRKQLDINESVPIGIDTDFEAEKDLEAAEYACADGSTPLYFNGGFERVLAVLGGQSSSVSIQLATLLKLFNIPQISYLSTSPQLSNEDRYPYFFRTVPSDINQAQAMLEILNYFNWTRAAVIYSGTDYGKHGNDLLTALAPKFNICFSIQRRIERDNEVNNFDIDDVLNEIVTSSPKIRIVLVFAEKAPAFRLLEAAKLNKDASDLIWISSDAWRKWEQIIDKDSPIRENIVHALAVQPLARELKGFDDYFASLRPETHQVNPWFNDAWKEVIRCPSHSTCTDENLTTFGYKQQRYLHFIRDAVYAIAYALDNIRKDTCHSNDNNCDTLRHLDESSFIDYLRKVQFKDEGGKNFRFLSGRDGPPRYSVLSLSPTDTGTQLTWRIIGNFSHENGKPKLELDPTGVDFVRKPIDNDCRPECGKRKIRFIDIKELCCWRCVPCNEFQIVVDELTCADCDIGFQPTLNKLVCLPIPEQTLDPKDNLSIVAMSIAFFGLFCSLIVGLVFWKYSETPVIKAAGRDLSWILLSGIVTSFCVTFLVTLLRPSIAMCGLLRFLLGFCHALSYSAILAKTCRVARIFGPNGNGPSNNQNNPPKFTSPISQYIIVTLMTTIEVIILLFWLYFRPPHAVHRFPSRGVRLLVCEGLDSHDYLLGLVYPFILVGMSTIYAIKTRKCPGGFNEAKYIAFTNYTVIVLWLAFVPLFIVSSSHNFRSLTLAVSLSLSALVQLACLFAPKVYIVVWRPEKNTRENVMSNYHRNSGYQPTVSGAASGAAAVEAPTVSTVEEYRPNQDPSAPVQEEIHSFNHEFPNDIEEVKVMLKQYKLCCDIFMDIQLPSPINSQSDTQSESESPIFQKCRYYLYEQFNGPK